MNSGLQEAMGIKNQEDAADIAILMENQEDFNIIP